MLLCQLREHQDGLRDSKDESENAKIFVYIIYRYLYYIDIYIVSIHIDYLTNIFHVAVRLFSNRSQMTSQCGKNKKVAHEAIAECVTDVLTTF